MLTNTRDLGFSHGAGKGDKNRADAKAFRDGYDGIDFGLMPDGFVTRGRKVVKTYGPVARPTVEHFLAYPTGILK